MVGVRDIVITGLGCVCPLGIGRQALQRALWAQRCAIRQMVCLSDAQHTCYDVAGVEDFDGKQYVTPRKALKVMGREIQMAYAAAHLAWQDAGLQSESPAPDRIGAVYGTEMIPGDLMDIVPCVEASRVAGKLDWGRWGEVFEKHIFPLWMLKYLPNMPACHVGIAVDARGPNNSIALDEASGLLALGEAADILRRGDADVMIVGACGTRVTPTRLMYRAPGIYAQYPRSEEGVEEQRGGPFDLRRRGIVPSEGAAALVLETRAHAVGRGANILGVVAGHSSRFARPTHRYRGSAQAVANAARDCMEQADITDHDLAHVSAQGFSQQGLDIEEASAIAQVAPRVPVTAFSSYFGTAGAAGGLLELISSILAVRAGCTLPTLGYESPDPQCAIDVCRQRQGTEQSHILKLSFTLQGQAAAVVVQCNRSNS